MYNMSKQMAKLWPNETFETIWINLKRRVDGSFAVCLLTPRVDVVLYFHMNMYLLCIYSAVLCRCYLSYAPAASTSSQPGSKCQRSMHFTEK